MCGQDDGLLLLMGNNIKKIIDLISFKKKNCPLKKREEKKVIKTIRHTWMVERPNELFQLYESVSLLAPFQHFQSLIYTFHCKTHSLVASCILYIEFDFVQSLQCLLYYNATVHMALIYIALISSWSFTINRTVF